MGKGVMRFFMVLGAGAIIYGIVTVVVYIANPVDHMTSVQNGQTVECTKPRSETRWTCTDKDLDERGNVYQDPN